MERTLSTAIQNIKNKRPITLGRFNWEYLRTIGYNHPWGVEDYNRAQKDPNGYLGNWNGYDCYLKED